MKILLAHNYYQHPGGEDQCFHAEVAMLKEHGHEIVTYEQHNDNVARLSKPALMAATIWNRQTYRDIRQRLAEDRPDIVHCHNVFPLISPAIFYAAHRAGVPVVQTLHNYRLLCPGALLLRDGRPCQDCIGRSIPWPAVAHKCYRGSRTQTLGVVSMLATHRMLGTWLRCVTGFLAPSEFSRRMLIDGGLPSAKIRVKPNFVADDPKEGAGEGDYVICVGRLSGEKGIATLLKAWGMMSNPPPLKICGDGPLMSLRDTVPPGLDIEFLGQQSTARLRELVKGARLLVAPSECYEVFGLTVIEAFACGTPVLVSKHGALAELVAGDRAGVGFRPRDPADLAAKATMLLDNPDRLKAMRSPARREYETKYTAAINHRLLMEAYGAAPGQALS